MEVLSGPRTACSAERIRGSNLWPASLRVFAQTAVSMLRRWRSAPGSGGPCLRKRITNVIIVPQSYARGADLNWKKSAFWEGTLIDCPTADECGGRRWATFRWHGGSH